MEDILASIKRIIAEDGETAGRPADQDSPAKPAFRPLSEVHQQEQAHQEHDFDDEDDDLTGGVLELTQPLDPEPLASLPSEEPESIVQAQSPFQPAPQAQPEPPIQPVREQPVSKSAAASILSDNAATMSRQSLAALSAIAVQPENGENTLEGLVREMLRPMLKQWLDDRLPVLVERLVEQEIRRITGR